MTKRKRAMNWDVWLKKFGPLRKNNYDKKAPFQGCLFHAYGREGAYVRSRDKHFVWTLVGCDDMNKAYLLPGFHMVRRIGYVITKEPWTDQHDADGLSVLV